MAASPGHVEVQRTLDSITVGTRHRADLGDIAALIESIKCEGLLQPITVTPDGVLVCGRRRLEALRQLGHRTTNVWVRSGLTDRLSQLLAEQNDNALHKPLSLLEAESLYRELKVVMAEDATRRQAATRFGTSEIGGISGGANLAPPEKALGKSRAQAAKLVTGRNSYTTMEKIGQLRDLAHDDTQPPHIREQAMEELAQVETSGKVNGSHLRISTALSLEELDQIATDLTQPPTLREQAAASAARVRAADDSLRTDELAQLAADAIARVKASKHGKNPKNIKKATSLPLPTLTVVVLPPRAFVALWDDLDGWTRRYDPVEVATALTIEQRERFERVLADTLEFAEAMCLARIEATAEHTPGILAG